MQEGKKQEEKKADYAQDEKKKKLKAFLGKAAVFLVMIGISIATSSVNLTDELQNFVRGFFDAAIQFGNEQTDYNAIYIRGNHVTISTGEYRRACQMDEIMEGSHAPEEIAQQLKETKTLAYYGKEAGFAVTKDQIEQKEKEQKALLQDKNSFQYKAMCDDWGTEKKLWALMEDTIKEQILASRVIEEKTKELSNRADIEDVDAALQSYIDELVEKEKFEIADKKQND